MIELYFCDDPLPIPDAETGCCWFKGKTKHVFIIDGQQYPIGTLAHFKLDFYYCTVTIVIDGKCVTHKFQVVWYPATTPCDPNNK